MGTHMPQGLKIALFACLGAILPWGIVAVADVPSTTFRHVGCCPPNAKNFGYFDTKWRDWPCDQRPEKVFPAALGSEVLPPPAGQVPLPLPKATVLPTKPETPGTKPEQPPAETQPAPGTPAEEGMTLPGEKMTLPGEGVPPPSKEVPAEGPAPKRTEKSTEPATPAPKKPTLDGSLPGLQPDTSPPPAAVEGPVAPLPPGSKAPSPQPQLQVPAAKAAEDAPAPKPAKQPDAKAELPADPTTMLPYQPSHVVQAAAFEPLAAVQPARVARADWTAPQRRGPHCKTPRKPSPRRSPVWPPSPRRAGRLLSGGTGREGTVGPGQSPMVGRVRRAHVSAFRPGATATLHGGYRPLRPRLRRRRRRPGGGRQFARGGKTAVFRVLRRQGVLVLHCRDLGAISPEPPPLYGRRAIAARLAS